MKWSWWVVFLIGCAAEGSRPPGVTPDAGPPALPGFSCGNDDIGQPIPDERCPCSAGMTLACYTGPAATRGVGACRDGVRRCASGDVEFSHFGACDGSLLPSPERCNGLDDDCDGTVDPPGTCPLTCSLPDRDRDGDGWRDWAETAAGSDPGDRASTPDAGGRLVFIMSHGSAPVPASAPAHADVRVARADVVIAIDSSGSMAGTLTRIQGQFGPFITRLAGQVDDLAFGIFGFGDFPTVGANSEYDVPFYRAHRVMTARTAAGRDSIIAALQAKNIIISGLGPWLAMMRGGDEPEQGWEALRQLGDNPGMTYPALRGPTPAMVAPFSLANATPAAAPAGEEVGDRFGLGFRADAQPIIILVTDTTNHDTPFPGTTPASATRAEALAAMTAMGATVVGHMAWRTDGQADLEWIANATGARVPPEAWGSGAARPANCPAGACCVVAEDPDSAAPEVQPLPVGGLCTLVFRGDRYDSNLAVILSQAVIAVARGGRLDVGARAVDTPGDAVDATTFIASVRADGACGGLTTQDRDNDGTPDTFLAVEPGSRVCFRVTARMNSSVPETAAAQAYPARLQLTGNGRASLNRSDILFLVPPRGTCPAASP